MLDFGAAVRAFQKVQEAGTVTVLTDQELACVLQARAHRAQRAIRALDCIGDVPDWVDYELRVHDLDAQLWKEAAKRLGK